MTTQQLIWYVFVVVMSIVIWQYFGAPGWAACLVGAALIMVGSGE